MYASIARDKPPASTRVAVAMSGGVDSSVTAALLKEQGYDVIGITLRLYDQGEQGYKGTKEPPGDAAADAARVCRALNIPHHVLDYRARFHRDVIAPFVSTYLGGATPIPCVHCNRLIKFGALSEDARALGADCLVTGHYAQRREGPEGSELHKAEDPDKDQSYFLFSITSEQLDYVRFPLGGMTKAETRKLAERFALPVANKPESQDICFVPEGRYAEVIRYHRPEQAALPGEIVHLDGSVLGRHDGIINFTVGQRRGIGIGGRKGDDGAPLYVIALNAESRRVIVGPKSALGRNVINIGDVNWLGPRPGPAGLPVTVKLRSAMTPVDARFFLDGENGIVRLQTPYRGVSPGQGCVAYSGNRLLGGGWIIDSDLDA